MQGAKSWLLYACALCGGRFPLGDEMYANMSGTSHRAVLPCPCETRAASSPALAPVSLEGLSPQDAFRKIRNHVGYKRACDEDLP
jgi:hypothetical protein